MTKIPKINVDLKSVPLSEYPRPQLVRDSYLSLNGAYDLAIISDPKDKIEYTYKCIVPYSVETPLSNVNHLLRADEILVYNKEIVLPENFKKDLLILHFDGVDQICDVYVNNTKVGSHIGGYTKFNYDITSYVKGGSFTLSVVVKDLTDTSFYSRGKQVLHREKIFYTSTSGIYKSVWLESVPTEHIKDIKYTTLFDDKCLRMYIDATRNGVCKVKINNQEIIMNTNQENLIKLETFHPWSPSDPYLYHVSITFFDDVVTSYFGLRKVEIKKASDGYPRLYLNNKLLFIKGVLDQGYYFLGNLTPITNMNYLEEINNLKDLGYNTIRKHIKTESDLFYYYCDTQGMLVMQDFINGGEKYTKKATMYPYIFGDGYKKNDKTNKCYGRLNKEGQTDWIHESLEIQRELYSHPSIIIYTIFNEGWGQFDSEANYKRFKMNDATRLYDTTSGWVDFGFSDFKSVHNYYFKHKIHEDKYHHNRPQLLSEYGGYGYYLKDHFFGKKPFCYKTYKNSKKLDKAFEKLHKDHIIPLIKQGLMGTVYTQVSDVEDEINGLYTFDRKILKFNKATIQNINKLIDEENSKVN